MKMRFEGGPGESAERENQIPAQPTKPQDVGKNKEKDYVKRLSNDSSHKSRSCSRLSDSIPAEEKDIVPTVLKEDNNPTCLADELIIKPGTFSSMPSSCAICSEPDHWYDMCPWRKRIPKGVTQVGKGYVVEWGRAVRLKCVHCYEIGTHMLDDCPDFKKLLEENGGDAPLHPCLLDDIPLADC